jgi:hypothetical protein
VIVVTATALGGCSSANNVIGGAFGGSGVARMIDDSGSTTQTDVSLLADNGQINTGLGSGTPVGVYSKVSSGNITFDINDGGVTGNLVNGIDVSITGSTNYTIVLEGEPLGVDYIAFGFQDTNPNNNAMTVRYKVNNAAPNLATPIDLYIWPAHTAIPGTPTITALGLDQDTGSMANAPGDSYIPKSGSSTVMPAGQYDLAIVLTGTVANGTTDLFDATTPLLSLNNSYSLTVGDLDGTQNDLEVILAIDEPMQTVNQSKTRSVLTNRRH